MVAPFTTRTPKLPYDGKTPISIPASARPSNPGEIEQIPRSSAQGDRIELAKKRQPRFSGDYDQSGDASTSSGAAGGPGGEEPVPPSLVETAKYLDEKVQALAKEKNITLQELPEDNADKYNMSLYLLSMPLSVLASNSPMDVSAFLELLDKNSSLADMTQNLLDSRLGLELDVKVRALAKEKNIDLSGLSVEQDMVYSTALRNAVNALYQGKHEGSGSPEQRQAEDAILNGLLAARQNPSSAAASAPSVSEAGGSSSAPQAGGTPVTGGASSASGGQAVSAPQGATAPEASDGVPEADTSKTETQKNDPKKEEQNWKSGYIGWKAGIGAALLAAGIALKLTLIGIVPGLILAGIGAALMGWGGINLLMKDKKD